MYDYHCGTGQRAIKKVQPVLGGFDKEKYKTERVWATAQDGTKIPMSLVYRTDLAKLDGTDPLLLDAYGTMSYAAGTEADDASITILSSPLVALASQLHALCVRSSFYSCPSTYTLCVRGDDWWIFCAVFPQGVMRFQTMLISDLLDYPSSIGA